MRPDKAAAKAAGIPKCFRRYAKRYGSVGTKNRDRIDDMIACHKKNRGPMLDNGRDRALKRMALPLLPRAVIEGLPHVA